MEKHYPHAKFKHDSDCCTFLGSITFPDGEVQDMYYCPSRGIETILVRRSDDPSDYTSGMCFAKIEFELKSPDSGRIQYWKAMGVAYYLMLCNKKV